MKIHAKDILLLSIAICVVMSCQKSSNTPAPSGVVNVTNAVVGGATITLTTTNSLISDNNTVGSGGTAWFPLTGGDVPLNLGVPGVAATKTTPAIPAVPYFSQILQVTNASNYSLFLAGESPAKVDAVLIDETYPRAYDDSVCGVRFINLCPGSNPISVNIPGDPPGSEVAGLAYKSYSQFIKHTAGVANPSYTFEFRDAATGDLITSYNLTTPYFHNVTIALWGKIGGNTGIVLNNDY